MQSSGLSHLLGCVPEAVPFPVHTCGWSCPGADLSPQSGLWGLASRQPTCHQSQTEEEAALWGVRAHRGCWKEASRLARGKVDPGLRVCDGFPGSHEVETDVERPVQGPLRLCPWAGKLVCPRLTCRPEGRYPPSSLMPRGRCCRSDCSEVSLTLQLAFSASGRPPR